MPKLTIIIGLLLTALGVLAYFAFAAPDERSWTALIPAIAGIPLVVFGALATLPGKRKLAMHVVVVFALLGAVAPLGRLIPTSIKNGFEFDVKSGTHTRSSSNTEAVLSFSIRARFSTAQRAPSVYWLSLIHI